MSSQLQDAHVHDMRKITEEGTESSGQKHQRLTKVHLEDIPRLHEAQINKIRELQKQTGYLKIQSQGVFKLESEDDTIKIEETDERLQHINLYRKIPSHVPRIHRTRSLSSISIISDPQHQQEVPLGRFKGQNIIRNIITGTDATRRSTNIPKSLSPSRQTYDISNLHHRYLFGIKYFHWMNALVKASAVIIVFWIVWRIFSFLSDYTKKSLTHRYS